MTKSQGETEIVQTNVMLSRAEIAKTRSEALGGKRYGKNQWEFCLLATLESLLAEARVEVHYCQCFDPFDYLRVYRR